MSYTLLILAILLAGCAVRPASIGHRVQGIPQAQAAQQAQAAAVAQAQASSAQTSAAIAQVKVLAKGSEGKSSVVLQWLNRQERKAHQTAP